MEVEEISGKVMTPIITIALLFSMAFNLIPQQTLGLQSSGVRGFWEDLFGSKSDTSDIVVVSTGGTDGSYLFMQVSGVDGESMDKDHKGWIDILSFSMGMTVPGGGATGPTRRRGDVVVEDIVVVKELDKSSPKLMDKCVKGEVIPLIDIHVSRANVDDSRTVYYKYELTNVVVTSFYEISGAGSDRPEETVTLNFEEIKVTYTETDSMGKSKGNIEFNWKYEEGIS